MTPGTSTTPPSPPSRPKLGRRKGRLRDEIARTLHRSHETIRKATVVVEAAERDPARWGWLVKEMNRSRNIHGAYEVVMGLRPALDTVSALATAIRLLRGGVVRVLEATRAEALVLVGDDGDGSVRRVVVVDGEAACDCGARGCPHRLAALLVTAAAIPPVGAEETSDGPAPVAEEAADA